MNITDAVKKCQQEATEKGKEDILNIKERSSDRNEIISNLKSLSLELEEEKSKIKKEYLEELKKLEDKFCIQHNYVVYRNREIVMEIDNMTYQK